MFFFNCGGDPRVLHSSPTRRISDRVVDRGLVAAGLRGLEAGHRLARRRERELDLRAGGVVEGAVVVEVPVEVREVRDRKSTRLNSSHANISYAVFCLKKNICR